MSTCNPVGLGNTTRISTDYAQLQTSPDAAASCRSEAGIMFKVPHQQAVESVLMLCCCCWCCREPELVARIGAATALEVRATGISYTFAPCIAVCRDPRWGRCYESFSEDPQVVSSMTTIIDGLQGKAPNGWKGPYVQNRFNGQQLIPLRPPRADASWMVALFSSIRLRNFSMDFEHTIRMGWLANPIQIEATAAVFLVLSGLIRMSSSFIKVKVLFLHIWLIWILLLSSPSIMLTAESRILNKLWACRSSSFEHVYVFLVSVLGSIPNHTPIKNRCLVGIKRVQPW